MGRNIWGVDRRRETYQRKIQEEGVVSHRKERI